MTELVQYEEHALKRKCKSEQVNAVRVKGKQWCVFMAHQTHRS